MSDSTQYRMAAGAIFDIAVFLIILFATGSIIMIEREKRYWENAANYTPSECHFHEQFYVSRQRFGKLGALTYMVGFNREYGMVCRVSEGFHSWERFKDGWKARKGATTFLVSHDGVTVQKLK